MNNEKKPLTYRFHLPCGQELLPLLEQQYITASVLKDVLRSRGTFINTQDKNVLIGEIMLTYLTPIEFDYLMSIAIEREEKRKVRNDFDELDASSSVSFADSLPSPEEIQITQLLDEKLKNCNLVGSPALVRISQNHYKLKFELRRRNLHSSWIKSEQIFAAEINVIKDDKRGVVKIENWHTSEETRVATRLITHKIRRSMVTKGLVKKDQTKTLRFNSFTNAERIAFLMKFTGQFTKDLFKFEKLVDLALRLDPKSNSTDERLTWMKNKVSKLNLSGSALEDTFFVCDESCRDDLLVWKFECRYSFDEPDGKGTILIAFEFGGYAKTASNEAPFQIAPSRFSGAKYHASHKKLEKKIISTLNDYQLEFEREVKKSSNTPPSGLGV